MKKFFAVLIVFSFLSAQASVAFAGHYRHSYYHRYHGGYYGGAGNYWAAWGVGVLTGAVFSSIFYPPAPRVVVYQNPLPVVVYSPPPAVLKPIYVQPPPAAGYSKVKVGAEMLNVRTGPGLNHAIAVHINRNQILDVLGTAPGWFYVRTPTGIQGWVMIKYTISPVSPVG